MPALAKGLVARSGVGALSVGRWTEWHAFRTYLGRHQSLRSRPEPHENELSRAQLSQAEAAQGLHVHENVGRALAAGEKTETAQPFEALHLRTLEGAGRSHGDVGTRRGYLRRMHRRRVVHGENAERLQAARALQHLDHDACTLVCDLESVAPQTGHVQEDVGHPVVGNDEAVTLGDVEPLDDAGELDDARGLVTDLATGAAGDTQTAAGPRRSNSVRGHDAPTPPLSPGASCARFESWPLSRIAFGEKRERPKCIQAPKDVDACAHLRRPRRISGR